jgi:hypothetical protein
MNWDRRQTKSASRHIRRVYSSRSDASLTDLGIPVVPGACNFHEQGVRMARSRRTQNGCRRLVGWVPPARRRQPGVASPASPRRVGAQRSRTVRNLRTDRAHRITTFDHHRAAHDDTSRRGHQPVLRCHCTNTLPGTKGQFTAIIDGGAIGLMASNAVPRTGDGDR